MKTEEYRQLEEEMKELGFNSLLEKIDEKERIEAERKQKISDLLKEYGRV